MPSTSSFVPHSGSLALQRRHRDRSGSQAEPGDGRGDHLALSAPNIVIVQRHDGTAVPITSRSHAEST